MNYESMSDFEINKAVTEKLGIQVTEGPFLDYQEANKPRVPAKQGCPVHRWVDYCNNPSDAWPIIIENKISIINDVSTWEASIDFDGDLLIDGTDEVLTKHYAHKKPLRASMIVFLMIQND